MLLVTALRGKIMRKLAATPLQSPRYLQAISGYFRSFSRTGAQVCCNLFSATSHHAVNTGLSSSFVSSDNYQRVGSAYSRIHWHVVRRDSPHAFVQVIRLYTNPRAFRRTTSNYRFRRGFRHLSLRRESVYHDLSASLRWRRVYTLRPERED